MGLHLAYWAYPYKDVKKAEEIAKYPPPWEHAVPGDHLPANWPTPLKDAQGHLLRQGWNTQHNTEGKLENQFMVSINRKTHQISFDFKGSDAASNFKSALGDSGASEFAKIQAKAQAAYEHLSQHPEYKNYQFFATGHSLGGGMAQSFALKNNIDAAVYNSLPIARETQRGDYYKSVGGYEAALARYQASGRVIHDVRTPNDIATYTYDGVLGNDYLSERTGQPPTLLPGAEMPNLLKTALLLSKFGTLPTAAAMSKDHTMGALVDAQQGLSLDPHGRYRIPQGQIDFSEIPAAARARFARLSTSAVSHVGQVQSADEHQAWNRYQIEREDGSRQWLSANPHTGEVEIEHYGAQGQRSRIELNPRRGKEAVFTELDAQGQAVRSEKIALGQTQTQTQTLAQSQPQSQPQTQTQEPIPPLNPQQQAHAQRFREQLGPKLEQMGLSEQQIQTLTTAAVTESKRFERQGEVEHFWLSKNCSTIAIQQQFPPLREFSVSQALARSEQQHWGEAVKLNHDTPSALRTEHSPQGLAAQGFAQDAPEQRARA